jgi:hypothetical protein
MRYIPLPRLIANRMRREVIVLEYLVSRARWSFHCLHRMAVLDIFDTLVSGLSDA